MLYTQTLQQQDFMVLWHNRLIVSQMHNCGVKFLTEKTNNYSRNKPKKFQKILTRSRFYKPQSIFGHNFRFSPKEAIDNSK